MSALSQNRSQNNPLTTAIHCPRCGNAIGSNAHFCPFCGGPLLQDLAAPAPPPPGVAGHRCEPQADSKTHHSRHPHYFIWSFFILVLGMAAVATYMLVHVPDPGVAVDRAHDAYSKQDLSTFDEYVDLQAVLGDGIAQFANYYEQEHQIKHAWAFNLVINEGKQIY